MNSEDAADMVEEYQQSYMTKEKGGLKCATAVMHTAISHILKYPSVAADSETNMREAKHLATRTVNAFSGENEWSHSLMAYALAGYRSYLSSDTFWYVFPHKLVARVEELAVLEEDSHIEDDVAGSADETINDSGDERTIHDELDAIVSSANLGNGQAGRAVELSNTRARMHRVGGGETVVETQATSYQHRGELFKDYSPLEFEMIVDLLPRSDHEARTPPWRGRPKRKGFELGAGHALFPHYQGFIRAKFKTPMLGGGPPPSLKENGQPSVALSKYLLCLLMPWAQDIRSPPQDVSPLALVRLCKQSNSASASFISRERYRYLHNILQKRSRSSRNEKVCSEWRSQNAELWDVPVSRSTPPIDIGSDRIDGGVNGVSTQSGEFYDIAVAAAAKNKATIQAARAAFWAMIPDAVARSVRAGPQRDPIFRKHLDDNIRLSEMVRCIHAMRSPSTEDLAGTTGGEGGHTDSLRGDAEDEADRVDCSSDQRAVYDRICQSIHGSGGLRQTLTLLHGGGGTGKSTLIRRIVSALERHGIKTINTCPTGVGASLLQSGRTIHSALKISQAALSANDLENLRLTFTSRVWLIVVDEVSMLCSQFLVLLDARLRAIYRTVYHLAVDLFCSREIFATEGYVWYSVVQDGIRRLEIEH